MAMPVEKAKDFKGSLRRLVRYLKSRWPRLLAVLCMAVGSSVFTVFTPKVMGTATNILATGFSARLHGESGAAIDFARLAQVLLMLGGLYVCSALLRYAQEYLMAGLAQGIVYELRQQVSKKLSRLPLRFFDGRTHGELLSRVTNDVDNLAGTLQQSITQIMDATVMLIGVTVMMLTISPILTLLCVITLSMILFITRPIIKRSREYFRQQQRTLGQLNGHVEEMLTGHMVVKAFGREAQSVAEFEESNSRLCDVGWRAQFISGTIMPLMMLVNNIDYVVICVVGSVLITRRAMTIGDLQAFIQYSRQFSRPIQEIAGIANILQSTVASAERVFELLDEEEEIPDPQEAKVIAAPQGEIRFENVAFSYNKHEPLISDMNLVAKPGQTVAIVGPTGAGKTTLVNLLMRFYEVDAGRITVDGVNIADLRRGDLRSMFGMVLQDTWLFSGTIRENIAYGRDDVTDEEIVAAAKAAWADNFIRTLPNGYDTVLNEDVSNISQGQKQLLCIARDILANPSMLILDEATSNVDTRTEVRIQQVMLQLMKGRTSFVIAHRLSTIRNADVILVMNEGRLVEKGKHEELLAKGGFYADLYNSQFGYVLSQNAAG